MFECAGRERDCLPNGRDWGRGEQVPGEPLVKSLQREVKKLSQKLEAVEKSMQRLRESNDGNAMTPRRSTLNEKTNEIQLLQISLAHRVLELEAASAEIAKQLPLFAKSAELAEFTQSRTVSRTYISEVSTEDIRNQQHLPEGFAEQQEKINRFAEQQEEIDLRLSTLEQGFSKFEQRLSKAEEATLQRPQLTQHLTQADDLTTTIGNPQSAGHGFADERFESSLTEQLSQLSEKVHKESLVSHNARRTSTASEAMRSMKYAWRSSIWDTAIFSFSEQMNPGESIVVVACLVFTLTLLLLFTLEVQSLIRDKYARFDDTSQQEYYLWRTTVAHDLKYRNEFTDASLASTICNYKLYAPVSSLQLQTAHDLEDYLQENNIFSLPAGQWMAMLCLCVWYLALVEEFRIIVDLLGASSTLKIGPRTTFERDADDDDLFHIVRVSHLRRFCIGFMMILRFAIVCVLGWQGTLFLLSEVDLESMILNSVALQMMLTFDDLMFQVVPPVPQAVVDHMKPLKIPSRKCPRCWHEWGHAIYLVCCASTALILSHVIYTVPFLEDIKNSYEALCGGVEGSYDFVVAVDAIGIPWAAATTPISDNMQEAYAQRAIAAARTSSFQSRPLQSSQRFNLGLFMQVASSQELEHAVSNLPEFNDPTEWSLIDPVESADVVGWKNELLEVWGQQDFADEPDTVYNHYLQYLLNQTGNVSCAQVPASSCTKTGRKAEDVVMRKLCPTHCGCASPTEGTVANPYGSSSRSNFTGCAVWNTRKKAFVDRLRDLPCADTQSLADFISWSKGVGHAVHNSGGMMIDHLVSTFESGKCPHVAKIDFSGLRICQETSLPSICPESCGCNTSQERTSVQTSRYDFCPYTCHSSQPPCITVVVTHAQDPGPRGPHAGFSCVFPFKFQGVTYHSCTSKDWSGPWCAVTLLDGVSHLWGDCPDTSECVNRST